MITSYMKQILWQLESGDDRLLLHPLSDLTTLYPTTALGIAWVRHGPITAQHYVLYTALIYSSTATTSKSFSVYLLTSSAESSVGPGGAANALLDHASREKRD